MHAKPLLLLRLTGSNSEKKSKTVAHCGKTRHHREPAIKHTKKKIVAIVHSHQQGATVRGEKTSDLSNGFSLEGTRSTGMTASDKTTVIWKILEKKKKELFGRVQILTSSHLQWWCRMARSEAVDQLCCPRQRGSSGKKNGTACIFILAVFYSCCSYYH